MSKSNPSATARMPCSVVLLRLAGLAAVWIFTTGSISCSTDGGLLGGPTFVTDLTLKKPGGAVSRQFSPGELITLELSVRNRTRAEAVLQFSSAQQFDFVVFDAGTSRVRWKWSDGRSFAQVVTEIEFAAGETKTFTVEWNQVGRDGQSVGVGEYEARGVLPFSRFALDPLSSHELGSPLKSFSIR